MPVPVLCVVAATLHGSSDPQFKNPNDQGSGSWPSCFPVTYQPAGPWPAMPGDTTWSAQPESKQAAGRARGQVFASRWPGRVGASPNCVRHFTAARASMCSRSKEINICLKKKVCLFLLYVEGAFWFWVTLVVRELSPEKSWQV